MTRGVVLEAPKAPVRVMDLPAPEPAEGQVLVKMEACGICHSDLFIAGMEKPPVVPLVLGHEGIGRVEKPGPGVRSFVPGDRVGITFLASTCGACEWCRAGRERFCPRQTNSGYTAQGVLAGYASIPAQHLFRVPEGLSAADAAPLCCAGWTAYHALSETGAAAGDAVAIFGVGGLGHFAVQYARERRLRVAAVDTSDEKLALARELGAATTVLAENAGRTIQKNHGGVDAAVVFTASLAAISQALRSLKRCGTLVLAGMAQGACELPVVEAVLKGITVRGSYLGTRQDLEEVLRLASSGTVRPHVERHSIDEAPVLFEKMRRGELMGRAVIEF
ncbi:MAG TPA: zinc-dependent alcohol dehydrogenase [Bryobacteraceae bacterium]|nr:zinc-dependent alcohol dehydrogenase [Bryobacteraceae bacterium]HUJ20006.1 zinc-dependent alcohol dehydrogenase [Bryobacteraceae bacterium]